MNNKVKIQKLEHCLSALPSYATPHSAGMDLFAANVEPIIIESNEFKLVPTEFVYHYLATLKHKLGLDQV